MSDKIPKPSEERIQEVIEVLGRSVQEAWNNHARSMPNPPASWLRTYDEVSEPMRRTDRNIGVNTIKGITDWALRNNLSVTEFARLLMEVAKRGEEKL